MSTIKFTQVGTQAPPVTGAAGAAVTPTWGVGQNRAVGNLLVCQVSGSGHSYPPATPAGWSVAAQELYSTPLYCSSTIFYKLATGGDAAPTFAGAADLTWSATLNESTGIVGGQDPLDQVGVVVALHPTGTVAAAAPSERTPGELIVTTTTVVYYSAQTSTVGVAFNNGAVDVSQNNNAASVVGHYSFDYGFTNTNAAPDQAALSASGGPLGICSVIATFTPIKCYRKPMRLFGGQTGSGTNPWTTRVDGLTQLDPNSDAMVQRLTGFNRVYLPASNVSAPLYIVPPDQPLVPINVLFPNSGAESPAPIPPNAVIGPGQDAEIMVMQQQPDGTWTSWEFWVVTKDSSGNWHCRVAMKRQHITTDNPGYSRNVQTAAGKVLEQPIWGVAASRFPLYAGTAEVEEFQAGSIEHALELIVHDTTFAQWSFPAQWTDGQDSCPCSIPYGARFRLDPTLNVDSLGLDETLHTLAVAAQKYGMIVGDRTLGGNGISMGSTTIQAPAQGYSLWSTPPFYPYSDFRQFPWGHLQLLPLDLRTTQDMTLYVETEG